MSEVRTFLFALLLSISVAAKAQTKLINEGGIEMQVSAVDTSLNALFCYAGQAPVFPGGKRKLLAFAKRLLKYPQAAVRDHVEGTVILQFVIDTNGKVTNRQIHKSIRQDIDSVCLRMLNQMPDWEPAHFGGNPLAVNERWRITFVLIKKVVK